MGHRRTSVLARRNGHGGPRQKQRRIKNADGHRPQNERETGSAATPGPELHILVIDPKALTRALLSHSLGATGPAAPSTVTAVPCPEAVSCEMIGAPPDIVILNIGSLSVSNAEVRARVRQIEARFGTAPIIVISDRNEHDEWIECLRLGIRGYISTAQELSAALEAIRLAHAGNTFLVLVKPGDVVPSSLGAEPQDPEPLTTRELEVMRMIRTGKPNKIIAHELRIRESTLKSHIRRLRLKVKANTRVELAMRAREIL